jgi:hypothetical protein
MDLRSASAENSTFDGALHSGQTRRISGSNYKSCEEQRMQEHSSEPSSMEETLSRVKLNFINHVLDGRTDVDALSLTGDT